MRPLQVCALVLALASCSKDGGYSDVAKQLSPLVTQLSDPARIVMGPRRTEDVIAACTNSESTMWKISSIRLPESDWEIQARLQYAARDLIASRNKMCERPSLCVRWCRIAWDRLAKCIDEVAERAEKSGVQIPRLR